MKLYANLTSERASKGQGGNDYLDIDIFVGSAKNSVPFARLTVRRSDDLPDGSKGYGLFDADDNILKWVSDEALKLHEQIKGNKQKGEEVHSHDWEYLGIGDNPTARKCSECGELEAY